MKKLIIILAAACLLSGCIETSDGERAGIITKLSKKGVFWKTWEGELHYAGQNGTIAADSWTFSMDSESKRGENVDALAALLLAAQKAGTRVKISYKEELFQAPWRGCTGYFVQSVEDVK